MRERSFLMFKKKEKKWIHSKKKSGVHEAKACSSHPLKNLTSHQMITTGNVCVKIIIKKLPSPQERGTTFPFSHGLDVSFCPSHPSQAPLSLFDFHHLLLSSPLISSQAFSDFCTFFNLKNYDYCSSHDVRVECWTAKSGKGSVNEHITSRRMRCIIMSMMM